LEANGIILPAGAYLLLKANPDGLFRDILARVPLPKEILRPLLELVYHPPLSCIDKTGKSSPGRSIKLEAKMQ
jgi:hypothetical protein